MSKKMSPFDAGYLAGNAADSPMDDFEMSMRHDDFIVGYIVGHSEIRSFRVASHHFAARVAGELGYLYNVPPSRLLPHFEFDAELCDELQQAYAHAADAAAEDAANYDYVDNEN